MDFQDEFRGKTVVLTGAYGIFGTWIAEAFAAYGARLCLSGSSMIRLEALAAKLAPTMVAPPLLVVADLTSEASIAELAASVMEAGGSRHSGEQRRSIPLRFSARYLHPRMGSHPRRKPARSLYSDQGNRHIDGQRREKGGNHQYRLRRGQPHAGIFRALLPLQGRS